MNYHKDKPTRQFVRDEKRELLNADGKSYEPPIFYLPFYDREDGEFKLLVYLEVEDETEKKIDAFGGLIDRTAERDVFDLCPIAFTANKKRAALALKDGRLREFIEDAIKKDYDKWPNEIRPEIRELLTDFCLAYWRRELFDYCGKVDGEGEDDKRKKETIEDPDDIPDCSRFNVITTGPAGDWSKPENEKEPVKQSAAFFDGDIDAAKTVEDLDRIAAALENQYVGTEDNRQRLLKRIEAERARMTGETPEDQGPRVMETETSPGAILEELAPLFPYGGVGAKIIVDQNNMTEHVYNADVLCVLEIRWRETNTIEQAQNVYQTLSKTRGISRFDWEYKQH